MGKSSTLTFLIILLIGFVDYLGIGLVYPIFAVLMFDESHPILPVGSSPEYRGEMLGILIALTPLSQFLFSPLLGAFSDARGRKLALLLGITSGVLGYLLAVIGIVFNLLSLLFIYRILVGVSDATAAVAQAALADISTEENKAKRFAYLSSSIGFGFTFGPFLGGIIADSTLSDWFSYSTPLIVAGLLSLMNLVLVFWKFPKILQHTGPKVFDFWEGLDNIRKLLFLKKWRIIFLANFALAFGWAVFNEFIPLLLRKRFDFSLGQIGEYYAFTGIWYGLGALIATLFMHRFKAEKLAVATIGLSGFCMLLFALFTTPQGIWWTIPVMMCALACALPTVTMIVSTRAGAKTQGQVLGVYQSVGAAGMGLSPLFVGSLMGANPVFAAIGGALSLWLASALFCFEKPQKEPSSVENQHTSTP